MKTLSAHSRIAVAAASLLLIATYFLPIWRIELWAPQYPEGLLMNIWLTHLSGDVDIINGLNHYIGMAHIDEKMFPEFGFLTIIVGVFMALGLAVAAVGKRWALLSYIGLLVFAGVAALADFYRWGYQYGHNLDPNAAIKVPGMSYQPPVLGYKELLNFGAYSVPDFGGWVVVAVGLIAIAAYGYELFLDKKSR